MGSQQLIINFSPIRARIDHIDYENKIIYHNNYVQGQHVNNFVDMFRKQDPWGVLLSHGPSDIIDQWRREYEIARNDKKQRWKQMAIDDYFQ